MYLDADASERTGRAAGALQPSTVHDSFVHAEEGGGEEEAAEGEEAEEEAEAEDEGDVDEDEERRDGEASEEAKGTFISRGMLA